MQIVGRHRGDGLLIGAGHGRFPVLAVRSDRWGGNVANMSRGSTRLVRLAATFMARSSPIAWVVSRAYPTQPTWCSNACTAPPAGRGRARPSSRLSAAARALDRNDSHARMPNPKSASRDRSSEQIDQSQGHVHLRQEAWHKLPMGSAGGSHRRATRTAVRKVVGRRPSCCRSSWLRAGTDVILSSSTWETKPGGSPATIAGRRIPLGRASGRVPTVGRSCTACAYGARRPDCLCAHTG